jgi:hypothetical protein
VVRLVGKARAGLDARRRPVGRTAAAGPLRLARVSARMSGGHAPAIRTAVPPGRRPKTGRTAGRPVRPSGAPAPAEVLAPGATLALGGIPVPGVTLAPGVTLVPGGALASSGTPAPGEVLAPRVTLVPSGALASSGTPAPGEVLASSGTPDPSEAPASGGRPGLPGIAGHGAAARQAPAGRTVRALPAARSAGETAIVAPSARAPGDPGMARTRARREARGTRRTAGAVPSARPEMPVRGCPTPSRPSSSTPRPGPS